MKTEHTPEPWSLGEDNDGWYVEKDGLQIAHGLTEEDARRIVACVNACAGLPVEVLERYKLGVIGVDYKSTKQQRDELLAALEELSLYVAYNGDDWVQKKARAAIASVKGRP